VGEMSVTSENSEISGFLRFAINVRFSPGSSSSSGRSISKFSPEIFHPFIEKEKGSDEAFSTVIVGRKFSSGFASIV